MHPSPLTPESITEYILFNSEYSVIICNQCKCALAPGEGIKRHFQNLHQAISLQIRKEIIAYCETLTLLPNHYSTLESRRDSENLCVKFWVRFPTKKKITIEFP